MLAESDNDSYEEEVDTDKPEFDFDNQNNDNVDNAEGGENPEGGDIDVNLESGEDAGNCENGECDTDTEGGDVWDEIDDCKDSDGEYDLRGKDIKTVLKVIQSMDTNDGLRIIKNDDETATVETEDGETEFTIDINDDGENTEPNEFEQEMGSENTPIDGNDGMDAEGDAEGAAEGEGVMDDINLGDIESDGQGDNDEVEFELELGDDNDENPEDEMVNEGNVNLGYTDNYQNKSAMTMPNDKGEGEGDSRFDDGAPKGGANNKKRWVGHDGQNGGNPYSEKTKQPMTEETNECGANCECNNECNEEAIFEMELDTDMPVDETHTRGMARKHNSVGRKEVPNTNVQADEEDTRNIFVGADQKRNCSKNESRMAAIERQANALLEENKQLKEIMGQVKQQLSEAVLINASLAKVIKLVTENATSRDEKINILNRFNKVQSLNECKNLYNQISEELKSSHAVNSNNLLNKQLTEAKAQNKNMIVETNMLNQSEDLKQILSLNERLINLGKK